MTRLPFGHLRFAISFKRKPQSFFSYPQSFRAYEKFGSQAKTSKNGNFTLKAGALGSTVAVVVGLKRKPFEYDLPDDIDKKLKEAEKLAVEKGSIEGMRRICWEQTRQWLLYYFTGRAVDKGPLEQDLVMWRGLHIAAADTRLYWIPSDAVYTSPVICVAFNYAWRASLKSTSAMTEEELDGDDNEDVPDGKWYAYKMDTEIMKHVKKPVARLQKEKGFERCLVMFLFTDVMSSWVYEDDEFQEVSWGKVLSKEDVTIRQN